MKQKDLKLRARNKKHSTKVTDDLTEAQEQAIFIHWLKINKIWYSASGSGVNLAPVQAMKLKRIGVAKGYPDVFVPLPVEPYHGFFLEMKKSRGGKVSLEQIEWIKYLQSQNYYAEVARGFDDAKNKFLGYVKDRVRLISSC